MAARDPQPQRADYVPVGAFDPPLLQFESNVTSQCGEDGVIARALELIGERDGWCVELGAWDGVFASNTFALIERDGYRAVLIESDVERFRELERTHSGRPGVIAVRRRVGFGPADQLDAILAATPIPRDFDLLVIDVDGIDYHVWDSLRDYQPKLVVIEFNPTIPNEVDFVQARSAEVAQGASLTALTRLAREKGYRLVHATTVNGIFVHERFFPRFGIADTSPAALRADLSQVTWMFQTYDGRVHIVGSRRVRWHDVPLRPQRLQDVPRVLRGFPPGFSRRRKLLYRLWRLWREPRVSLQRIARRFGSRG